MYDGAATYGGPMCIECKRQMNILTREGYVCARTIQVKRFLARITLVDLPYVEPVTKRSILLNQKATTVNAFAPPAPKKTAEFSFGCVEVTVDQYRRLQYERYDRMRQAYAEIFRDMQESPFEHRIH